MSGAIDPDRTVDEAPSDPLDVGLAAAFGPDSGPPLPAAGSVVQALGASPVQLREPDTEPADPVVKPHSDAVPAEAPEGLQLHGEIARGGMGAVLKGRDTELGRDVAVKVLLEAHQGRTELVQRFVEEAQVTGQLQHPGVVPVYEMGQLPDKRPYFTMKLVKGQTLAKLLAERSDPSQDRPRLLKMFEQVCQALAYAHARGVIHRDLKPSNVMVGAFGEVQVMDWGLAKVLQQGRAAEEKAPATAEATVIRTARSLSDTPPAPGSQTQAGQVLGTPAYMAPEQARGEVAGLDERCDVFGLGALLCHILTGQPPYAGTDAEAVYAQAARADLADAFARLDGCGADGELIGLAKRCLAPGREGRPRDAGALAAELNAYLGSVEARLRRAELDRAAAEARAVEERKRRRMSLALASAVLALVAVGAGGGLWVQHQAAGQRVMVESSLERAAALRRQAHWREAAAVLEQARQVLGYSVVGDLRRRLDVAEAELALVSRLDAIRQHHAMTVLGWFDDRKAEFDYFVVFAEAGLLGDHVVATTREGQTIVTISGRETAVSAPPNDRLAPSLMRGEWLRIGDEPAVAARVRASGALGPLVAALDDWALLAKEPAAQAWLLGVARRAAPDPWGDRFRDPAVWQDRQALQALADDALRDDGAKLDELSPHVLVALGRLLGRAGADAVPLLRAAQRRHPDDFWLSLDLGVALFEAKQAEEAVGYDRVAVALRPDAAAAHNNLGGSLQGKKDLDGAIAEFRKAIKIEPRHVNAHVNLGLVLAAKKDVDGAIAEYREAIRILPDFARPHFALGSALYEKKDLEGAIVELRKAIDLDPKDANAHNNLGAALASKKDLEGAVVEFRKAIDLDPNNAHAHHYLGRALLYQKRFGEARSATRRWLELLPEHHPQRQAASQQLQQCERLAAANEKLSAILTGEVEPTDASERLALAQLCQLYKRLHAAAARFYADAFAADPKLAADLQHQHRYNAACSATLAAAGQGEDAKDLPDKVRQMLRRQVRAWLRDDLAAYRKLAEGDEPAGKQFVREKMRHWQQDADLASVRDPEALDRLPEDERAAWRQLWADVGALLRKADGKE